MVGRVRRQPEGMSVTFQLLQCQAEGWLAGDRNAASGATWGYLCPGSESPRVTAECREEGASVLLQQQVASYKGLSYLALFFFFLIF